MTATATSSGRLLAALRRQPAGVSVITTNAPGPVGFCATSVTSVSLDPPIVCFAVSATSASGRAWHDAPRGIVHVLRHDQADLARLFATPGADRFGGAVGWRRGPFDLPLLDGVAAWLVVAVRERVVAGDHALVLCDVGEVDMSGVADDVRLLEPLVHHAGVYRRWRTDACQACGT